MDKKGSGRFENGSSGNETSEENKVHSPNSIQTPASQGNENVVEAAFAPPGPINDEPKPGPSHAGGRVAYDLVGNPRALKASSFWETQPAMKPGEIAEKNEAILKSHIFCDDAVVELPGDLVCANFGTVDQEMASEISDLLRECYVQHETSVFKIEYSPNQISWDLQTGNGGQCFVEGIRPSQSQAKNEKGKLLGFVAAIGSDIEIYGVVTKVARMNFLCLRKDLRMMGLSLILFNKMISRISPWGISQAVFTCATNLPIEPFSKAKYFHRPLQVDKLITLGFLPLEEYCTVESEVLFYQKELGGQCGLNFLPMEDVDIPEALAVVNNFLRKFEIKEIYDLESFQNCFYPRKDVVYSFVSKTDGVITDFLSYYVGSMALAKNDVCKMKCAYSYMNVATTMPLVDLFRTALVFAKRDGCDVYNALNIMDNEQLFEKLNFGEGTGNLNYYFFNWRCKPIPPNRLGLILP